MTAPGGLLDFFALEAAEYLDRLDALASGAGAAGPDADGLYRNARALRGSATMARQPLIAELAAALERVARSLREGGTRWDTGAGAAVISSVDELRTLVRGVKALTANDEVRARALASELDRLAPTPSPRAPSVTPVASSTSFLSVEIDELAASIAALRSRPGDRAPLDAVIERVRRLRGVAALRDLPPLAEVIEGVERAIRPLEMGTGPLGNVEHELLAAACDVFTRASIAMRNGEKPATVSPETRRFSSALARLENTQQHTERIVPIGELYYAGDGPHVVHAAEQPPVTRIERFRTEIVSLAEHLRRLVGDARAAADEVAKDRLGRELRGAMRTLHEVAESFGAKNTVRFVDLSIGAVARLDADALGALDEAAQLLSDTRRSAAEVSQRMAELTALRGTEATERSVADTVPDDVPPAPAPAIPAPVLAPSALPRSTTPMALQAMAAERDIIVPPQQDVAAPAAQIRHLAPEALVTVPSPAAASAPSGPRPLQALLQQGLESFEPLGGGPLAPPTAVTDDLVVPIDRLLYRGRAALDRALALREHIRRRGGTPAAAELDELFDLLDLVATE